MFSMVPVVTEYFAFQNYCWDQPIVPSWDTHWVRFDILAVSDEVMLGRRGLSRWPQFWATVVESLTLWCGEINKEYYLAQGQIWGNLIFLHKNDNNYFPAVSRCHKPGGISFTIFQLFELEKNTYPRPISLISIDLLFEKPTLFSVFIEGWKRAKRDLKS